MNLQDLRPVSFVFGPFRLTPEEHLLLRDGETVPLPPKVLETLVALVESHGRLVTKEDLIRRVWPETFVEEGSLTKCISQLRKVLGGGEASQSYIQTVPTKGYRFVAQVEMKHGLASGAAVGAESAAAYTVAFQAPVAAAGSEVVQSPVRENLQLRHESPAQPFHAPGVGPRLLWAVAIVIVAAAVFLYLMTRPAPVPVVTGFQQITHDGQVKLVNYRNSLPSPILTDGARLYFMEDRGAGAIVPVEALTSGGATVTLPSTMPDVLLLGISPDGTKLLASLLRSDRPDNPLWVLSATNLAPRPGPGVVAHGATWTPDGKEIIYASGQSLYIARKDGSSPRKLVTVQGIPGWARCSPDGRLIRFTVSDVNTWQNSLWQVSSDGSGLRPVLPGWHKPQNECCGSWTRDGRYYVFQDTQYGQTEIWALRARNWGFRMRRPGPVQLTSGPMSFSDPLPSRDGSKIFVIGEDRRGELVSYDPVMRKFTLFLRGLSADHVEFSRDQKWIAYSAFPESTIWRSRPDGTGELELTYPPMQAIFPRWSPNGKWLAFIGDVPGKPDRVYLVPADGGPATPMLAHGFSQFDPNWSPDGNEIMFSAYRPGQEKEASLASDIEIYNRRTKRISILPGSSGLSAPRWSPDGRYVAATAIENDKWQSPAVRLFDFRTGKWSPFENDPIDNKWWSHDGKYFYFDKYVGTNVAIFRENLSTRSVELVARLNGLRRASGMMGWWMGLTPNDEPMELRDTSTQEVYAFTFVHP